MVKKRSKVASHASRDKEKYSIELQNKEKVGSSCNGKIVTSPRHLARKAHGRRFLSH